jgi:hypothetical protein
MTPTKAVEHDQMLSIDTVTQLSREVAAEYDSRLEVIAVASSSAGESSRVEVLVTVRGCHDDPCMVMVNLSRHGQEAFERDLRNTLRGALVAHASKR